RARAIQLACLLAIVVACVTTTYGSTICYRYIFIDSEWDGEHFSFSGFRVIKLQSACPRITSVKAVIYDDANKNGIPDPNERVFGETHGTSATPSDEIVTIGASGSKNHEEGGTSWHVEIVDENGKLTTHGGTF